MIITELCSDAEKTEFMCSKILYYINDRIDKGEEQIYQKSRDYEFKRHIINGDKWCLRRDSTY